MRFLRHCIIILALLLAPAAAWGEAISFSPGYTSLLNLVSLTGAGIVAGTASTDDDFTVASGATVVTGHMPFVGGSWTVASGGKWIMDSRYGQAAHTIDASTAATLITGASGSTVIMQGGYYQVGVPDPRVQGTLAANNNTIWTVDQVGICNPAAPGAFGTCTSATREDIRLFWTDARNNHISAATNGNAYLDEALALVDAWNEVCFIDLNANDGITPMEAGFCYPITEVDSTGPTYSITIDITQPDSLDRVSAEYPSGTRDNHAGTTVQVAGAVIAGEKCVVVDAAGLSRGATSAGWMVGRSFRPLGSDYAYRIENVSQNLDCAGASTVGDASGDAVFLMTPLLQDIADDADVSIDRGIQSGDQFYIMAPVLIEDVSASEADGAIVLAGNVEMSAVVINGPVQIDLTDATITRFEDVHIRGCGDGAARCLILDGNSSVKFNRVTMSDGDIVSGGSAGGIQINDLTGTTCFQDVGFRYFGQTPIKTVNAKTAGKFVGNRIRCQYAGDNDVDIGCFDDTEGVFSSGQINNIECTDAQNYDDGSAGTGDCVSVSTNKFVVDGMMHMGNVDGGIGSGAGLVVRNMLLRTFWANSSPLPYFPPELRQFDIKTFEVDDTAPSLNEDGGIVTDGIFRDVIMDGATVFSGGNGEQFSNLLLHNVDAIHAACATTGVCYTFTYTFDGTASTVDILENISVLWDDGDTTGITHIVDETGAIAGETSFRFGGLYVANMDSSNDGDPVGTSYGISFNATADVAIFDTTAGPFCFFNNSATDGGAAYLDIHATAEPSYDNLVHIGVRPAYRAEHDGDYVMTPSTGPRFRDCGAKSGKDSPGPRGSQTGWIYSINGMSRPLYYNIFQEKQGSSF